MRYILDSSALIAYLAFETGGPVVQEVLLDPRNTISIHSLNLCEVYYDTIKRSDQTSANRVLQFILSLGINVVEDCDPGIWKFAGAIKAEIRKISLADTFCISLAVRQKATILTSDRKEFSAILDRDIAKVLFIR